MPNPIDDLMDLDPLLLTPENVDAIVEYHRRNRANLESGIKPKKETGPKVELDLVKLNLAAPAQVVRRRI